MKETSSDPHIVQIRVKNLKSLELIVLKLMSF